jgi:hypothetical protein
MPDLSSITLPDNNTYTFKDAGARTQIPAQASISSSGLITYKNSSGTSLFTLQLPIYDGDVELGA